MRILTVLALMVLSACIVLGEPKKEPASVETGRIDSLCKVVKDQQMTIEWLEVLNGKNRKRRWGK